MAYAASVTFLCLALGAVVIIGVSAKDLDDTDASVSDARLRGVVGYAIFAAAVSIVISFLENVLLLNGDGMGLNWTDEDKQVLYVDQTQFITKWAVDMVAGVVLGLGAIIVSLRNYDAVRPQVAGVLAIIMCISFLVRTLIVFPVKHYLELCGLTLRPKTEQSTEKGPNNTANISVAYLASVLFLCLTVGGIVVIGVSSKDLTDKDGSVSNGRLRGVMGYAIFAATTSIVVSFAENLIMLKGPEYGPNWTHDEEQVLGRKGGQFYTKWFVDVVTAVVLGASGMVISLRNYDAVRPPITGALGIIMLLVFLQRTLIVFPLLHLFPRLPRLNWSAKAESTKAESKKFLTRRPTGRLNTL